MVNYVRKTQRKTFKKKTVKRRAMPRKTLVKTIKAVVNRQAETKHINMDPLSYSFINANLNNENTLMYDAVNLADNLILSQGDSDGTRDGNKINITKCVLNINAVALTTSSIPAFISIYIGYLKADRSTIPSAASMLNFLQDGASSTYLDETTLSLLRNVNKDKFTIVNSVRFKLGASDNTTNALSNNDFPIFANKKISIKNLLGKMQYNDADTAPSKDLFMWMHVTGINSAEIVQPDTRYKINYYLDTQFKDF